jgi:hypothetical protein
MSMRSGNYHRLCFNCVACKRILDYLIAVDSPGKCMYILDYLIAVDCPGKCMYICIFI